jgi:hypothetical protein
MGIRNLNRFIQTKCPNASSRIHLEQLRGKKIAVDTSIYMYRFAGENALLENMYLMASLFRHYDIHAVFVFDGVPPPQKTELIEIRRQKKDQAKQQYDIVADQLKQRKRTEYYNPEIAELEETMTQLRKKFARLRDCDIANVKELLVSFGFAIIDAEGEADVLCAKLAIKKRVYACLSDDTDMFVYGCPIVLRHISLLNNSVVSYNMTEILKELGLNQQEFKMMCVANGTDYDTPAAPVADNQIFQMYSLLIEFKHLSPKEQKKYQDGGGFYDWLDERKKGGVGVISMMTTEALFDINNHRSEHGSGCDNQYKQLDNQYKQLDNQYKQLVILNRNDIQKRRIVEIMMKEDFIFIEPNMDDKKILNTMSSGHGTFTTSPVYGVGVWDTPTPSPGSASASVSPISPDDQVQIIANNVYGIEAGSLDELNQKYIQITRDKKKNRK